MYNFHTHEEEYCLSLEGTATSVAVSRDSRYMLVNLAEGQIQLIDIETTNVIRRFKGQKQGTFVIRSTFGGAAESFVFSGSEGIFFSLPPSLWVRLLLTRSRCPCLYVAHREW